MNDLNRLLDSYVQLYMLSYPENIDDAVTYREASHKITKEGQTWSPVNSANMKIFALVAILTALPADFELLSMKDLVSAHRRLSVPHSFCLGCLLCALFGF